MKPVFILLLSALALAATLPAGGRANVPLGGLKLVAEETAPASELASAGKNGNKNAKSGGGKTGNSAAAAGTFGSFFGRRLAMASTPDLVAVELR